MIDIERLGRLGVKVEDTSEGVVITKEGVGVYIVVKGNTIELTKYSIGNIITYPTQRSLEDDLELLVKTDLLKTEDNYFPVAKDLKGNLYVGEVEYRIYELCISYRRNDTYYHHKYSTLDDLSKDMPCILGIAEENLSTAIAKVVELIHSHPNRYNAFLKDKMLAVAAEGKSLEVGKDEEGFYVSTADKYSYPLYGKDEYIFNTFLRLLPWMRDE